MEKAKISLIRTFGRRRGKKLSARQRNLVDAVLPALLPADKEGGGAILEIGFGNGEHLILLAEQNPDKIIIGAEPFENGVAQLLAKITGEQGLVMPQYKNIRVWPDDIRKMPALGGSRFDCIYILHPDPWPKARHEKRRLLSAEFLKTLGTLVSKDGSIIVGTDHADYYDWILEQAKSAGLKIKARGGVAIKTKYQEKNLSGSKRTMYLALFPKA